MVMGPATRHGRLQSIDCRLPRRFADAATFICPYSTSYRETVVELTDSDNLLINPERLC
ncbi:hypothetical protein ACLK1S_14855 [Escherichia coli]